MSDPSLRGSSQITVYFELKAPVTFVPHSEKTSSAIPPDGCRVRMLEYSRRHKSFAKARFTMFYP